MKRALLVSWIAFAGLTGCAPLPGTELDRPLRGAVSFPAGAWIAPVAIADPAIDDSEDRARLSEALTLSLAGYVADTRYLQEPRRRHSPDRREQ